MLQNLRANISRHPSQGDEKGFTLIEVILVIVVIGIAIPSLVFLLSSSIVNSNNSVVASKAVIYAQEKMEEIIADKKNPARGYDWVINSNYESDVPAEGFSRSVFIETNTHNAISYALIEVTVSHNEIPNFELTTWLTEY